MWLYDKSKFIDHQSVGCVSMNSYKIICINILPKVYAKNMLMAENRKTHFGNGCT